MNHRTTGRRLLTGGALALTAGLVLAGCGDDSGSADDPGSSAAAAKKPELAVSGAYVPVPATDDMAGGFLKITNKGAADTLVSASSPLADSVTLHATVGSTMKERTSFAVPANGELDFARGGNHLMLEKLRHKPKQGDKVEVTLRFEKSEPITVTMAVEAATHNPDAGSTHESSNTKTHSTTGKHASADQPTDPHASH